MPLAPSPHPAAPTVAASPAPLWRSAVAQPLARRTTCAHDADEHAALLTGWEQHYDQLSGGRFTGELAELHLPQMQVFRERMSRAVRQSCTVWSDALWLGLPELGSTSEATAPTRIDGRVNLAQHIMVRPGDAPFELMTPDDHSIYGIVVRQDAVLEAASRVGAHIDWATLAGAHQLQVPDATRAQGEALLQAALCTQPAADGSSLATSMASLGAPAQAALAHTLQAELIDLVLRLLDQGQVDHSARQSLAKRQQVVARARAHVLDHPDQAVTVPELCEQLHVSRRTLQYCFEDVLGLSPLQYLRAIRLNGVRRQLRQAAAQGQSVQDVAVHWGFWHFSQFATDYRKLFGEAPSATLKAGPATRLH